MSKVFLGGTCNGSTWRDDLIPYLEDAKIDYFNPVVEDWTEDCIEEEERQKNHECDIHLYVITKDQSGPYSLCEALNDAWMVYTNDESSIVRTVILYIVPNDFDKKMLNSIKACADFLHSMNSGNIIVIEDVYQPNELTEYIEELSYNNSNN